MRFRLDSNQRPAAYVQPLYLPSYKLGPSCEISIIKRIE